MECGYREYLPVSMHIVKTNHQNRDSLELFSAEGLFLRNLGIKEFVLWRDFISTDLGDYRIFSHWSGGILGMRPQNVAFLNS